MNNRWMLIVFCIVILNIFDTNHQVNGRKQYESSKLTKKNSKYQNKLSKLPVNSSTFVSNLKMDEIMVPIKKLTRKRMIKLLIKSIKRVKKNAKNLKKSDNESIEFRPTFYKSTRKDLKKKNKEFEDSRVNQSDLRFEHPKSIDQLSASNRMNVEVKGKNELIRLKSAKKSRNEKEKSLEFISPASQYADRLAPENEDDRQVFLRSNDQVLVAKHLSSTDPLFTVQSDFSTIQQVPGQLMHDYLLNSRHSPSTIHQTNIYRNRLIAPTKSAFEPYSVKNDARRTKLSGDQNALITTNEGQLIRINIPIDKINHFATFVEKQFDSADTQKLIRNYVRSQLNPIDIRSDIKNDFSPNQFLKFIAKQLDIDTDRKDEATTIQNELTKVLGAFVGDIVGVVVEEILHKRGDKIVDGIRTKIGDIATLLINKSNLTLEMAFRNLSKLIVKKKL